MGKKEKKEEKEKKEKKEKDEKEEKKDRPSRKMEGGGGFDLWEDAAPTTTTNPFSNVAAPQDKRKMEQAKAEQAKKQAPSLGKSANDNINEILKMQKEQAKVEKEKKQAQE